MKRIISLTLLLAMLFSLCLSSLSVFAEESDADANNTEDHLSYDCVYNTESKKVTVSGNMNHETFARYNNSTLVIYAIPPGMSEYDVINDGNTKPLAETDASLSFGFSFTLNKLVDRYSRYAIFLRSETGEMTLATEAQYPELASSVERDGNRAYFKGISTSLATVASDADVGNIIIPIYLDSLFTEKTNGYVYQVEGKQLFFDRNYIDSIDTKINSLSISKPKVYLRFLLRGGEIFSVSENEKAEYYMPDLYNEQVLTLIHAATDFLISRYENQGRLGISGIVMGKGWDDPLIYNSCTDRSFDEYVRMCGLYTVTVANAARSVKPSTDIVIPFAAKNFQTETQSFTLEKFTETLLGYLDNSFSSGIDCSFMLESEETPFGISNQNIDAGIDLTYDGYASKIYPGGQKAFSNYLTSLSRNYKSAPADYMFLWSAPKELSGNALAAAYAYSYYALISDSAVSAFTVNFAEESRAKDILNTVKYIDTNKSAANTGGLLKYFGVSKWTDIEGILDISWENGKLVYTSTPLFSLPSACKGSFNYFDFSKSISIDGWTKGSGCSNIRIDYPKTEGKALRAELTLGTLESSEIIYFYEYYENMSYTPYLKFDMQINDTAEDSLYEVSFLFENSGKRFESACVIKGDELSEIVLDMSEYNYFNNIENIKISVRSLYGEADSCTLWLYGISGHSEDHSSEELGELIEKERSKIKNISEEEEESSIGSVAIAVGLLIVTGALGIGLFIAFRKDGKSRADDE